MGLRVLVVTRLFPNAAQPNAASFNRQQLSALGRRCDLDLLAVIPWFPGAGLMRRWSAAGRLVSVPPAERIDGLDVRHPRVLYLPRVHFAAPALYAASLLPALRRAPRPDVVLGSWAFPDGVAAVALGRLLGAPVAVKLHGSDMNVIADLPSARLHLRWALPRAGRVIAVSRALADKARALGVRAERLAFVPNGVDRDLFRPRERAPVRAALSPPIPVDARLLLFVGSLLPSKGVPELLAAFARLAPARPELRLALVGDGPERARCEAAAAAAGGRLIVAGPRPLPEVALWMAACDALVLPSWNEGTPNVVLEALASGRRVVATRVGGIPDVVSSPESGELVPPRDVDALAAALARAADRPYDSAAVAAGAPGSWDESAARLAGVLEELVSR